MSENDFLYALKDDLPQDFSDQLREQLRQIEDEEEHKNINEKAAPTQPTWWVAAAASVILALFGVLFFVNNEPNSAVMNIENLPPTLTNHGEINPETISQLQSITALGNGFARRIRVSPDGEILLVDSTAGIYLHDADDLNAEPVHYFIDGNFQVIDFAEDGTIYGVIFNPPIDGEPTIRILSVDPDSGETRTHIEFSALEADDFEISPDGRRLFVQACLKENVGERWCDNDSYVTRIYDTENGVLGAEFPSVFRSSRHSYQTSNLGDDFYATSTQDRDLSILSDDGSLYVYVARNADNTYLIYLMNVGTGETTPILEIGREDNLLATEWLTLTPDNQKLIVKRMAETQVWDLDVVHNADPLMNVRQNDAANVIALNSQMRVFFHPIDSILVSVQSSFLASFDLHQSDDRSIKIYSITQGDMSSELFYTAPQFHPSGDSLFALLGGGQIARYSYPDGILIDKAAHYDIGFSYRLRFRDDTHLMSIANQINGALLREWSLETDHPEGDLFKPDGKVPYEIHPDFAVSPDGRYISYLGRSHVAGDGGFYWLHDLQSNDRYPLPSFRGMEGMTFTADNTLVGLGGRMMSQISVDDVVNDVQSNSEEFYLEDFERSNYFNVNRFPKFSDDASLMLNVSCFSNDTACEWDVLIWDVAISDARYGINIDNAYVEAASFSADTYLLALGTCQGEDILYQCNDLSVYDISQLPDNASGEILAIDYDPILRIDNFSHPISKISFHPQRFSDGSYLMALSDRESLTTFVQVFPDGSYEQIATLPFGGEITFSPNGNLILTTNERGLIEIWGVPGDKPVAVSNHEPETSAYAARGLITAENVMDADVHRVIGAGKAQAMALSPDNTTLAIATGDSIYLHDAHNLNTYAERIEMNWDERREIEQVTYTENGDLYVFTSTRETLWMHRWDADANQFILVYSEDYRLEPHRIIQKIRLSLDGSKLILGICDYTHGLSMMSIYKYCLNEPESSIEIHDLNDADNTHVIMGSFSTSTSFDVNPDWSQLAYVKDGAVYLYDISTQEVRRVIEIENSNYDPSHDPWAVNYNFDGSQLHLVSAMQSNHSIWSVAELNAVDEANPFIHDEAGSITGMIFSTALRFHPTENAGIASRNDSLIAFSTEHHLRLGTFSTAYYPRDTLISDDGKRVYALNTTGVVNVWDWESQNLIDQIIDYTLSSDMNVAFSPDSEGFVNYGTKFYRSDSSSFIWDIDDMAITRSVLSDDNAAMPMEEVAISPDNRYVAYARLGKLTVYDREMDEQREIDSYYGFIMLAFRDDASLVSLTAERGYGFIKTYTPDMLETGDVPANYEGVAIPRMQFTNYSIGEPSEVLSFSPDANLLAVYRCGSMVQVSTYGATCIQNIIIVDTVTNEVLLDLEIGSQRAESAHQIQFSPDGAYFALSYCGEFIPEGTSCEDDKGAIEIWRVDDILDGTREPLIHVEDLPYSWTKNKILAYGDDSFLLGITTWQGSESTGYAQMTDFWRIEADSTVEQVYSMVADGVNFSPDGRMMLVLVNDHVEIRIVPEN